MPWCHQQIHQIRQISPLPLRRQKETTVFLHILVGRSSKVDGLPELKLEQDGDVCRVFSPVEQWGLPIQRLVCSMVENVANVGKRE
jgi:hypothetical protein